METYTKSDLKNGQLIEFRDGSLAVITSLYNHRLIGVFDNDMYMDIDIDVNDDLTHKITKTYDIMRVYAQPAFMVDCIKSRIFDPGHRILIWERKEIKEMTMAEVCKALGYEVKIVKE